MYAGGVVTGKSEKELQESRGDIMPFSHKIRTFLKTQQNKHHRLLRQVAFGMHWWVSAFQLSTGDPGFTRLNPE